MTDSLRVNSDCIRLKIWNGLLKIVTCLLF